jgi:hypothetical protein
MGMGMGIELDFFCFVLRVELAIVHNTIISSERALQWVDGNDHDSTVV